MDNILSYEIAKAQAQDIKILQKKEFEAAKSKKNSNSANNSKCSMASDSIPENLKGMYLGAMRNIHKCYFEMSVLCLAFGLRNIEARELKIQEIDLSEQSILLSDSKQIRSFLTKSTNLALKIAWIPHGQALLHDIAIERGDHARAGAADYLGDKDGNDHGLENLAVKLGVLEQYQMKRESFQNANYYEFKTKMLSHKDLPKGRKILFSKFPHAREIIKKRYQKALENGTEYLFTSSELTHSNRAVGSGFICISRQSFYRTVMKARKMIENSGKKFKKMLNKRRLGLHSCRKTALQREVRANGGDLNRASLWIGHGSTAMTSQYLEKSEKTRESLYANPLSFDEEEAVFDEMEKMNYQFNA